MSIDNTPEEGKDKEHHEWSDQILLPDEATKIKRFGGCSVEQRCNDSSDSTIVAAHKDISKQYRYDIEEPYEYCAPQRISAECCGEHEQVDHSGRIDYTNGGNVTCSRQQSMINGIMSHAENHRLVFIRSEEHTSELQSHLNLVCRL